MLAAHDGAIAAIDIVKLGVAEHENITPLTWAEIMLSGVAVEGFEVMLHRLEDLIRLLERLLAAEHQLVGRVDAALDDAREGVPVVAPRGDADEVRMAELVVRVQPVVARLGGVDLLLDDRRVGARAGREAEGLDGVEVAAGELPGEAAHGAPAFLVRVQVDGLEAHDARGVGVADRGVSLVSAGWVGPVPPLDDGVAGDGDSQDDWEAV